MPVVREWGDLSAYRGTMARAAKKAAIMVMLDAPASPYWGHDGTPPRHLCPTSDTG